MAFSHKQDMLSAIAGLPTARMPWVPRLDLWYKANKLAGTLPRGYENASRSDIEEGLQAGTHAIIPDFKDLHDPEEEFDRALGVYNLRCMPCRTVFENVSRNVRVEGDRTFVEYLTPAGKIQAVVLYDESMRRAGITITHVEEHAFKGPEDYDALGYLFENARVESNYHGYVEYADRVGERGLAAAFVSLAASPVHLIQRELMPLDVFFFEMHDHPEEFDNLSRKIGAYWNRLLEVAAGGPAELVFLGANYDADVTYPPFFHEHIEPWLRRFAEALHAGGKYLLTHADGENTGLLEHYLKSRIDVADSICPAPMTKLSLKEVRDVFADKITIMGGIPSVALLPSSMPDKQFEAFLDRFFDDLGDGRHLILGISDTTPPAADFDRLRKIARRAEQFGPVNPR